MLKFTIKEIIEALKDNFKGDINLYKDNFNHEIKLLSTDSREAASNETCFIALKGKRADDQEVNAHRFVEGALNNGSYAIVSEDFPNLSEDKQKQLIRVKDTIDAFGQIGNLHRQQFKGKLIGITGSSGKTSTKDMLKTILLSFGKTYATPKNLNSQLGVPQCLIDMTKENYDYAIIEMGMSGIGEMKKLTSYTQPDIAIAINVYPMHLEFFKSIKSIAAEKASIFEGLKDNGIAIYNADSQCADILSEGAQEHNNFKSYGRKGSDISLISEEDTILTIKTSSNETISYEIPENNLAFKYNSMSTMCICQALGLPLKEISKKYKEIRSSDGRGKIKNFTINETKNIKIIDESYGGGHAEAMIIGLTRLQNKASKGRKIAIIGNMAELGIATEEEHKKVGQFINTMKLDKIILIGENTKIIQNELDKNKTDITTFYDKIDELLPNIENNLQNNDLVFIKGAHYSSQVWKIIDKFETTK
ncbi:MAG: UDP-N-acetylmuramoyl-tripeptide--D-alanyl-D-alanine ligase [Alphaproteobacteria bacterium]|jgi:UDP-N-acetylmuramoyl-tripeptide--D-alanyl-D-alanine ligase|nr:UDP-N-acetylmuramoyl-tripeptide--D-alanyl-D-alanine ligase [Alphaproteobacteria bacterium]